MAYFNNKTGFTIYAPDKEYPNYSGWVLVDCGCSNGLEWGGEYPRECLTCNGSGHYAEHIKSGVKAEYPGGPFC